MALKSLASNVCSVKPKAWQRDPRFTSFVGVVLEQDKTDTLTRADAEAKAAADDLRALVDEVYGDKAQTVRDHVNALADEAIPPTDESATAYQQYCELRALASFYRCIVRQVRAGWLTVDTDNGASIFDLARELIAGKAVWHSGESVTVWQENGRRAYVKEEGRDGGGLLHLVFANGVPGQEARMICGHLSYRQGWVFNLTRRDYDEWTARAKRIVNGR